MKKIKGQLQLKDIIIGSADAKNEENCYYYDGLNYLSQFINSNTKFLILGKKGVGKTALAYGYAKKFKNFYSAFNIISQTVMEQEYYACNVKEFNDDNIMPLFYKYFILIVLARAIYKKANILTYIKAFFTLRIKYRQELLYIKKFIDNSEADLREIKEFQHANASIKGFIEQNDINNKGIEINGLCGYNKEYNVNEFYKKVQKLEDYVYYLSNVIKPIIIFDDIEDNMLFAINNMPDTKKIKIFIEMISEINNKIKSERSRIILILRDEIFNKINEGNSNNINKIKFDNSITIDWNSNHDKSDESTLHPLLELILYKIKYSNIAYRKYPIDKLKRDLFPNQIDGYNYQDYIFNATFGRPRDLIAMLSIIQQVYPEKYKFDGTYFGKTRKQYSEHFYLELCNELSIEFTEDELHQFFNIYRKMNKQYFLKEEIVPFFEKSNIKRFNNVDEFLIFCFNKSIIANFENKNGKKIYKWKYKNYGLECNLDEQLVLHNGISRYIIGK